MQNRVHAAEQRKEIQSRGSREKRTHRRPRGRPGGDWGCPLLFPSLLCFPLALWMADGAVATGQESRGRAESCGWVGVARGSRLWRRRCRISCAPPPSSLFLSPSFSSLLPFPLPLPLRLSTDEMRIGNRHDGDSGASGGRCRRATTSFPARAALLFPPHAAQSFSLPVRTLFPPFPRRADRAALSLAPFPSSGVRLSKSDALATTFGPRRRHMRGGRGEHDASRQVMPRRRLNNYA